MRVRDEHIIAAQQRAAVHHTLARLHLLEGRPWRAVSEQWHAEFWGKMARNWAGIDEPVNINA